MFPEDAPETPNRRYGSPKGAPSSDIPWCSVVARPNVVTCAWTTAAAVIDIVLTNVGSPDDGVKLTDSPSGTSEAPRSVPHVFPEASLTVSLADADLPCWTVRL